MCIVYTGQLNRHILSAEETPAETFLVRWLGPVVRTSEEYDIWLNAPTEEALTPQRPILTTGLRLALREGGQINPWG
jgi:hypothetical protein